jgi:hypothetical protein
VQAFGQIKDKNTMTLDRYRELMQPDGPPLTAEEIDAGWHFCLEFDGLLVGPEMVGEWYTCTVSGACQQGGWRKEPKT